MRQHREKQIEDLLLHFHNARQKIVAQGKFLHPGVDITFSQWVALEFIWKNKKSSIDGISNAMHISSSAATQLVNGLLVKGFVTKKTQSNDKRFSTIELSAKAKKIFNLIKNKKIIQAKRIFSNFTDRELKTFIVLIKRIT
jgi:DNA-binding MarR family transcriptional regulator